MVRNSVNSSLKMTRRKQYRRRTDLVSVDEGKQGDFGEQRLLFDGIQGGGDKSANSDEDMLDGDEEEEESVLLTKEKDKLDEYMTTSGDQYHNFDTKETAMTTVVIGEEGIQHILELFCTLGAAQRMLCSYHCKEAIQILQYDVPVVFLEV